MMALLSRETPISQLGGPAIVSANLRGADAVLIAGGLVFTEWWLMTRPDIKTAEKLKGGSVAIGVFGGLPDNLGLHPRCCHSRICASRPHLATRSSPDLTGLGSR